MSRLATPALTSSWANCFIRPSWVQTTICSNNNFSRSLLCWPQPNPKRPALLKSTSPTGKHTRTHNSIWTSQQPLMNPADGSRGHMRTRGTPSLPRFRTRSPAFLTSRICYHLSWHYLSSGHRADEEFNIGNAILKRLGLELSIKPERTTAVTAGKAT